MKSELPEGGFDMDNVILSGTHTHSGPAGYNQYLLLGITCLGYIDEAFQGLVTGIKQVSVLEVIKQNQIRI